MSLDLSILVQLHQELLLAEWATLLHDIGKFCDLHIKHVSGMKSWCNDDAYKVVVDDPGKVIHLSKTAANIKKPDIVNNVLSARTPKAADFLPPALKGALEGTRVRVLDQDYTLAELIMLGMPGFATHMQREKLLEGKDGWLPALLGVCHSEAHTEKEEPGDGGQTLPTIFSSTAFGLEAQVFILGHPSQSLDARLRALSINASTLTSRGSIGAVLEAFSQGLGDTRRPINEVTLADWSAAVAALFKPALATAILSSSKLGIRQWLSWKDKTIDHDFHWRLLRVNFDVLSLYAKAVKIADLLGYQRAVNEACAAVKYLVEDEYPLGNEVYRDTTGTYFSFPDVPLPAELAQEIRRRIEKIEPEIMPYVEVGQAQEATAVEQIKRLLADQRQKALRELAQPVGRENLTSYWQQQWANLPAGRWEICPICRLRPKREDAEVCDTCRSRRDSRVETWLQDPSKTIWLDELANSSGRVALIVAKFGLDDWLSGDLVQTMLVKAVENAPGQCRPKNPSPARLRRVWETTRRFWTETVGHLLDELPRRTRWELVVDRPQDIPEQTVCDGSLNGQPISVWRRGDCLLTISYVSKEPSGTLKVSWEVNRRARSVTFQIREARPAEGRFLCYRPSLTLLASPDQFLALIPASEALDVAGKIHGEYQRQFGKVQNRLPLFLGLVFFQRKMPLMAVMDTARRMLATRLCEQEWTIRSVGQANLSAGGWPQTVKVTFENGIAWTIPTVMGDNATPDLWYPYFFLEDDAHGRQHCFQLRNDSALREYANRWLVHVNNLKEGDTVVVTPSRFAYLYLESTAQRFAFDHQRDVMLLDELPRLMQMWKQLRGTSEMSDTKLQAIRALFESKWQSWNLEAKDEGVDARRRTFQELVTATFKREGITGISPQEVMNRQFGRCLDLYLHVLKRRVSKQEAQEVENERQPETV